MTEPTWASEGTKTRRIRVDGSNLGSTHSTGDVLRMSISSVIVNIRYAVVQLSNGMVEKCRVTCCDVQHTDDDNDDDEDDDDDDDVDDGNKLQIFELKIHSRLQRQQQQQQQQQQRQVTFAITSARHLRFELLLNSI
uniref:Uncharacterized protein n=1 Tax=Glossina austeni TaxID=7395 RepID=A0A1A9UX52_GLOAU